MVVAFKHDSGTVITLIHEERFRSMSEMDAISKKRLLIFAHYYHPDVASTGQLLKELAEGMQESFDITVICVVPSYEGIIAPEYKKKKYYHENINGVTVLRVRVPEFQKGHKLSRVRNISSYFFHALRAASKTGRQDYIFTISQPPILGGLLGVLGKQMKHAKLVYCIQDFNPEQIIAVGYSHNKLLLKLMLWLDKQNCRKSDLVVTVGCDLVQTLSHRFQNKQIPKFTMINNWIDEKTIYPLDLAHPGVKAFRQKYGLDGKFVIMYSGNIGLYYDLENLLKVMCRFPSGTTTADGREVVFAFVGGGGVLDKLKLYGKEQNMDNVVFIPYQKKENLIFSLNAGDVQWCVSARGIKGCSVPSKIFGLAAVGRPVLGVLEQGSEVHNFILTTNCGVVSEPGDYDKVEKNIKWFLENAGGSELIEMGMRGRRYLEKHLTREASIKKYEKAILGL